MPHQELVFNNPTESSITVTWVQLRDVPHNMAAYYRYYRDYRLKGDSDWPFRSYTTHRYGDVIRTGGISGLEYNTIYEVQVRSARRLGGLFETMDTTPVGEFTTKCEGTHCNII